MIQQLVELFNNKSAMRVVVVDSVKPRGSRGDNSYTVLTEGEPTYAFSNESSDRYQRVVEIPVNAAGAYITVQDISQLGDPRPLFFTVRETKEQAEAVKLHELSRYPAQDNLVNFPRDLYTYKSYLVINLGPEEGCFITWLREIK